MKSNGLVIIIIIFFQLLIPLNLIAQTNVSGIINENTTWHLANSPFLVTDNILIESGISLYIEPGVTVQFSSNKYIRTEGALIARGNKIDSIHFQSNSSTKWKGLEFKSGGGTIFTNDTTYSEGSILEYVKIDNATLGTYIHKTGLLVKHSSFRNNSRAVEVSSTVNVLIDSTSFVNNTKGITSLERAGYIENFIITNSNFNHNEFAIDLTSNQGAFINLRIEKNKFTNNNTAIAFGGGGYGPKKHTIFIKSNSISSNTQSILVRNFYSHSGATDFPLRIEQNIIENSELGISITSSGWWDLVKGNLLRNLTVGVEIGRKCVITFEKNIFYDIEHHIRIGSENTFFYDNTFISDLSNDLIKVHNAYGLTLTGNNFLVNHIGSAFIINNFSKYDINAQSNYWNTSDETTIANKIFDKNDNFNKGEVDFSNFSTAPTADIPMSTPQNVFKGLQDDGIYVSWKANEEANLAGYKIYSKSNLSDDLTLLADVGNVTSYLSDQIVDSDLLVITSYNDQADGASDLLEGNESGYSEIAERYFSTISTNSCEANVIEADLNSNYNFADNYFILQLSDVNGDFENAVNLDSISNTSETLLSVLPDTLQFGETYFTRVLSSELRVFSNSSELTLNQYPTMSFEAKESVCYNENYQINFVGTDYTDLLWNFNEANIISGSESGPYLLNWSTSGQKSINFTAINKGCALDTTIIVNVTHEPYTPDICIVTVDEESSKNMLVWNYDLETVNKFGIYRETNVAGDYSLLEYIDGALSNTYIDYQSSPEQQSNRYKITSLDSCGTETELSIYHKTIHLTINKGLGNDWNLIWDGYEGFSFGTYRIYRSLDGGEFEVLTDIASNLSSYTDSEVPTSVVAYQIEVLNPHSCDSNSGGRVSATSSSRSNIARNTITGISEIETSFKLFPNPSSGFIRIETSLQGDYHLHTLTGQKIMTGTLTGHDKIDMTNIPTGTYLLTITANSVSIMKKIIRQ